MNDERNLAMPADEQAADLIRIRATLAHLLAATILERDSSAKFGICATTDVGFRVDVLLGRQLSQDQLGDVMGAMQDLIGRRPSMGHESVSLQQAQQTFLDRDQPFQAEIAFDLAKEGRSTVDLVHVGKLLDIAAGPIVEDLRQVPLKGCRLDSVSGAYWKGNDANQMLTRIVRRQRL
jgi:threonyl-tRNA synthetase